MAVRVRELVVVHDVGCPRCSRIAHELPECVTVKVRVRACTEPRLAEIYPNLPADVARCARPAVGVVRVDGSVRWWVGLRGAIGVLPVLRPGAGPRAVSLLRDAARGR
ncbi:hypothetical protein [Pseudonocardia sp. N23]|uniref:hypothetical protein n=1 Tax=Pseudonocardia sp. N23 TaxID=1987376 RepID=UPI000BFCE539|nr:hypothetical protein [Pseudonocardia sp. N23]GAY11758.1 hypothetical protein TOK_0141 [Pseudonocardia sp. N23]